MKKLLFCLLFAVPISIFAQEQKPKFILKTTPSYIFDIDNTFTLGAEYLVRKNMSIQGEVGYGNTNQNLLIGAIHQSVEEQKPYRNFDVVRAKTEIRFYSRKKTNAYPTGLYHAIEVFYKYIGKESEMLVGRNASNFTADYWEKVLVNKNRQVFGSHFKLGSQFYIFDANIEKPKHWLCDFYIGLGFRNINNRLSYDSKREFDQIGGNNRGFGKIFTDSGQQNIVSGTLGFKLGYIIY